MKACHNFDHRIDETLCSSETVLYLRTKPLPGADDIDIGSILSKVDNHTSGLVHIRWTAPIRPNGMIDGYQVEYKRVDIENVSSVKINIPSSDALEFSNSQNEFLVFSSSR